MRPVSILYHTKSDTHANKFFSSIHLNVDWKSLQVRPTAYTSNESAFSLHGEQTAQIVGEPFIFSIRFDPMAFSEMKNFLPSIHGIVVEYVASLAYDWHKARSISPRFCERVTKITPLCVNTSCALHQKSLSLYACYSLLSDVKARRRFGKSYSK